MGQLKCEKYNAANCISISHLVFEIYSLKVATKNENVKNWINRKPNQILKHGLWHWIQKGLNHIEPLNFY